MYLPRILKYGEVKKEMTVMFFNHFVAASMLSILRPSRCFFVCLQPVSNIWGGKNFDVEEAAVVQWLQGHDSDSWIKVKKNSYCGVMSLIVFWDYIESCTLCVVEIRFIIVTHIRDLVSHLKVFTLLTFFLIIHCTFTIWNFVAVVVSGC